MSNTTREMSWWERDAELSLDPASTKAEALPESTDFLIVGAGFAGRWLALFLARAFQRKQQRGELRALPSICVIERDAFGYGASSRNAGFLTAGHLSEMLADASDHDLDAVIQSFFARLEGIELARSTLDADADALGIYTTGSIDWDEPSEQAHELASALNQQLVSREMPPLFQLRMVNSAQGGVRRYLNLADGTIHPVRAMQKLEGLARELGVSFHFAVEAQSIGAGSAQVKRFGDQADEDQSHEIRYRHAIICTNGFAKSLAMQSNIQPGRGQVVLTSPVEVPWGEALGYLHQGYDYFRSVDGRLLLGGGRHRFLHEETSDQITATQSLREYLHDLAKQLLGHERFSIEHHWAGVMGFPGGAHALGSRELELDSQTTLLAGFGGMGVALTPSAAHNLALRIASG